MNLFNFVCYGSYFLMFKQSCDNVYDISQYVVRQCCMCHAENHILIAAWINLARYISCGAIGEQWQLACDFVEQTFERNTNSIW